MFITVILLSIIVVFNIMILFYKAVKGKYLNLIFDVLILVGIANVLGGSTLALIIGNIASFIISIALYFVDMNKLVKVKQDVVIPKRDAHGILHIKGRRKY